MAKRKTHDINEVANDPTDVFAEAAQIPAQPQQTLQEALAATMPPAHAGHGTPHPAHAEHHTHHAEHPHGNGHAQVVHDVAAATAEEYKPKWIDRFAE